MVAYIDEFKDRFRVGPIRRAPWIGYNVLDSPMRDE